MTRLVLAQLRRLRREMWHVSVWSVLGLTSSVWFMERLTAGLATMSASDACQKLGPFWGRTTRVLPITAREARRSAWLSTMVLVGVILVARAVATATMSWLSPEKVRQSVESLALMAIFDALYVSASFTFYDRDQKEASLSDPIEWVGISAWILLPFAAPEVIPRDLDAFRWWNWIALVGLAGLALRPLLVDRDEWPRLGVLGHSRTPEDPITSTPRLAVLERLSGFWRLAPSWAPGPLIGAAIAIAPLASGAFAQALPPMSRALPDGDFLALGGPMFLICAGPWALGTGLTPWLRRLKVLPVSGWTLVGVATLLPCRAIVALWVIAVALHAVQTGNLPETLRLGALVAACGAVSFTTALISRFNRATGVVLSYTPLLVLVLLFYACEWMGVQLWTDATLPVIGVITGAAAVAVNHRTLNYSSSQAAVYRPFGQAA
ncbi:MAG: hypothetical protein AB7L71_11100 [Vicinamibacterales bacterium]